MGVTGGGLDLGMAEELADHRQALAGGNRRRGEGVAQVVDADILDAGALADALPGRLQVGQVRAGVPFQSIPIELANPFTSGPPPKRSLFQRSQLKRPALRIW